MYSPMAVPGYPPICFERLSFMFIQGLPLLDFYYSIEKIEQ